MHTISELPISVMGACRCNRVKLKVTRAPLLTMACHCRGCQKMTASAFSLSAAIPSEGFQASGETVIGGLHGALRHYHCAYCMSWLFTKPVGVEFFVNLRSTMLDGVDWTKPFIETYTSEKLVWASTPAKYSFSKFPPESDYETLMSEYASTQL